tara:strand:- start:2660 stop:3244 length:585 start_codon:yes stop_codon:yes gene_type:complete
VIKPIYYKSFRSRNFIDFKIPPKPLIDIIQEEEDIVLDVGFGTGESSLFFKKTFPNSTICGIEAYKPGIKNLLDNNIFVHHGDALDLLQEIKPKAVSKIYMLFPDPWQKKKHRKRRLFNKFTFSVIQRILKQGGLFQLATDNINYAIEAKDIINDALPRKVNFSKTRGHRPITKFENKAREKNRFIFDIIYINE